MSKIDEARPAVSITPIILDIPAAEEGGMHQVDPAYSVIDAAQQELEGLDSSTLQETMEDMGFALGTRIRDQRRKDENKSVDGAQDALSDMLSGLDDDEQIQAILKKFGDLGKDDSQEPLALLRDADLSVGAMVMVLGKLLGDRGLEAKRRSRLEKALAELIEDEEDWELQLFSFLEVGNLPSGAMEQIRSIYQRQKKEDGGGRGLSEWFSEVQDWPDRQRRIRVLLRAISFDLSVSGDKSQQVRLAATIHDLRRLLLFLSLEEHSQGVSEAVSLDGDVVLLEVLATIEQSWLYPEWLEERLLALDLPESHYPNYLRLLGELISLLPEPCFSDLEQKEQIMTTFLSLQDRLNG